MVSLGNVYSASVVAYGDAVVLVPVDHAQI